MFSPLILYEEIIMAEFFGFEINRKSKAPALVSIVPSTENDGAGVINSGGHFGQYLDQDADKAKNEQDLIIKYRDVAAQPECDAAIEDIVNEAIVANENKEAVRVNVENLPYGKEVRRKIEDEFKEGEPWRRIRERLVDRYIKK